jgi:RHS repeat-associated protein
VRPIAALVTRFRYDGFGVARLPSGYTDPAATGAFPAGAGGDFRFHGHWLEADTGFYHMRARDYDPASGRFLSRDPVESAVTEPESYHPYAFANANPHFYSDPTGEFSVVEINFSGAIQKGLQGARTAAFNQAKRYVKDKAIDLAVDQFQSVLTKFLPVDFSFEDVFLRSTLYSPTGRRFGFFMEEFLCDNLDLPNSIWFEPHVNQRGGIEHNGFNCGNRNAYRPSLRFPRPDFIVSPQPPKNPATGRHANAWMIGEIKLQGHSLYRSYVKPRTQPGQWNAIMGYAAKHTISRTALFVTLTKPTDRQINEIRKQLMAHEAVKRGVIVVVVSVQ